MEGNICVSVRLLDRPDSEQPDPFFIDGSLKWRDLEAMLKAFYEPPQKGIDVRYFDDENDQIIVSCQDEFACALMFCKDTESVLQLFVRSKVSEDTADGTLAAKDRMRATRKEAKTEAAPKSSAQKPEEPEHMMMPGATSGANAVAIEMPDCCAMEVLEHGVQKAEEQTSPEPAVMAETGEVTPAHHHGTEVAEPAEMAETGEMAPKSRRDAETGFWMITGVGKKRKTPAEKTLCTHEGVTAPKENPTYVLKNLKKRDRQTEAPALKSEKRHKTDKESSSREDVSVCGSVAGNMSFPAFVAFMSKLKKELRTEIVHDVTKKTVKQVLRGLETLQLQSPQQETQNSLEGKTRANNWPVYTHESILCDNCERTIIGPRYKCGNCLNYDLCEECENQAGVHDENHVFLKLRRPCQLAGYRHGKRTPLLRHLVYTSQIIEEFTEPDCQRTEQKRAFYVERLARKAEKLKLKQLKMTEKMARKEEKLKRRLAESLKAVEHHLPPVMKRERLDDDAPLGYGTLAATFEEDVTLPDGVVVKSGQRLKKTWRVRNSGTMTWPAKTVLREVWSNMLVERNVVGVPSIAPGEAADISVRLIAPKVAGRYESHWRLQVERQLFGHSVYAIIIVDEDEEEKCQLKAESVSTVVVPMLKELCSDNMETLGSKMAHLTVSNADEHEEQAPVEEQEEDEEEVQDDGKDEEEVQDDGSGDNEELCEGEEESVTHATEPMSVAGMNSLLSFVMVEVERPERVHCPPPQDVGQYDDKDFWTKKLSVLPCQGEPTTPNNTPLDVSPPPERIIPIPEPELLRKLSLEAEASPEADFQNSSGPASTEVVEAEAVQESKPDIVQSTEVAQASPAAIPSFEQVEEEEEAASSDENLEVLESTPPHVDVEEDVTASSEGKLQAGRHLYDEGEVRPGQTPPKDLRWWEDREEREVSPVSSASSVEVMSVLDLEEEEGEEEKAPVLSEYMAKHTLFPPHGWTEDVDYDSLDIEAFDSLSDDSSIDDDFFIVKLPDCFDTSKPLVFEPVSHAPASALCANMARQKDAGENSEEPTELQAQAVGEEEEPSFQPSLDDMLQASGTIATPPLIPTTAPGPSLSPASPDTSSPQTPAGNDTFTSLAQGPEDASNVEAAAGEFQDAPEPPEANVAPSRTDSSAADGTSGVSAPVLGERAPVEPDGAAGGAAAGATVQDGNNSELMDPSQQVNLLMQSAVAVASKAAVRAFATAKDVFYTLQARQYEWKPSTWKPPQSTWKPPQSTWKPPQSEWKPPSDDWKPPSDDWKPPTGEWKPPTGEWKPPSDNWQPPVNETERKEPLESEVDGKAGEESLGEQQSVSEPMTRLWEMGFFNRKLNQRLLDKHNGDLEPVVQELLHDLDNDWAESRH